FVTPAWTMLGGIDDVVLLIVDHPLHVPVTISPNAVLSAIHVHEGIVRWNTPVIMQSVHLPHIVRQILRVILNSPISGAEIQISLIVKNDATAEMYACIGQGHGLVE